MSSTDRTATSRDTGFFVTPHGGDVHTHAWAVVAALLFLLPAAARAQTPGCDRLKGEQKALARQLLEAQHPYTCCTDSIAACLRAKPTCRLAVRLAENICRRVSEGQDRATIEHALEERARTMRPDAPTVSFDLNPSMLAGEPDAPVTLVEYACARCPYCARTTPLLHDAVAGGQLEGKAKLYFRPFPLRSHPGAKEAGMGLMAAAVLGRFWDYTLYLYRHFEQFKPELQPEWAAHLGIDRVMFERLVQDPALESSLVESKKEGIANHVEATPTLFIDGRKFAGEMSIEEITDVVEEETDRLAGKTHVR